VAIRGKNTQLLVIDPQVDFCDPTGALFVPGAVEDSVRLATMIDRLGTGIKDIHITLDSHTQLDISHIMWWKYVDGQAVKPFTVVITRHGRIYGMEINLTDGSLGPERELITAAPFAAQRTLDYLEALEKSGRYGHTIWPDHCIIGSVGHSITQSIFDAVLGWEQKIFGRAQRVVKGSNIWTEHFGIVKAEVPDDTDSSTQVNTKLIDILIAADEVFLAGQASTHCVANSVMDIADEFGDENIHKLILLEDATSPVPGFDALEADFKAKMTARGMQSAKTTDV